MNLIDRYIEEVGKHLPLRGRADIQSEIRSTLEDMLEDRSKKARRAADDRMVLALLKEYGAPEKVAASYAGPRYLIGPRLFPMFLMVVQIVVSVLFAVALAGLAINFGTGGASGPAFLEALGQFFLQFLGGAISAFGNIVIVFAILERVLPASELEKEEKEWDPAELASEPDPERIKPAEQIVGVLFTVLALVVLNLYPQLVGFNFLVDGQWVRIPVLSEAFFRYLPWINLLGVLQISFNIGQLRQRTWNVGTRIVNLLMEAAGIALAVVMLKGPALVDVSLEQLAGTPLEGLQPLVGIFNLMPVVVLSIVIIISSIEVLRTVIRLVLRHAGPPLKFKL